MDEDWPSTHRPALPIHPRSGHILTIEQMTIQRLDHVGIVVDDLAAATEFFVELELAERIG